MIGVSKENARRVQDYTVVTLLNVAKIQRFAHPAQKPTSHSYTVGKNK
jgi:hypothetical protein